MGLDENYDHTRNQTLLMEPLPSVNKAYSMVLRVEKQREVHSVFDQENNNVMMVRGQGIARQCGKQQTNRFINKRKQRNRMQDKGDKVCDNCKMTGHSKDSYFKLIVYSDWYKELREQKKKNASKHKANAVEERFELDEIH